ncbi:MAG: TorF family putative porin [Gammaproteobacteria bacterium]|nr:TorF family putative porin [Gammaproteobacteria bacterium]MDH5592300.1 TorF family putative porin [Gammaproteobacteria bacterium]
MKMKKLTSLCLAGSLLSASSFAMAWESGNHSTSANVALTTDYMWRGYSQTDNEFSMQGGFDYAHSSGLYAGTWASNIDYADDAPLEIDFYFGHAGETESGIGWDVGFLRYMYPGEEYDYDEVYAFLSYSYFNIGITHGYDVYSTSEQATYYSAGFDYELPMGLALSAGVGYYDYDEAYAEQTFGADAPNSTVDYRIGLSKEMAGFGFDLTYYDIDSDGEEMYGNTAADSRFVFTISKSM